MMILNNLTILERLEHDHGPLQELIEGFFCWLFKVEEGSQISEFCGHFVYDALRTFLVFFVVLFLVSYLKTYISAQGVQAALLHVNKGAAILLAALAGILSSTCVCTNVPLFFGFIAFGIPLHLAMTFLISSSLLNIASIGSMAALTDWRFTLSFIIASLCVSVLSGIILSFIKGEEKYIREQIQGNEIQMKRKAPQKERLHSALHELKHTFHHQWLWLLIGVLLSAIINSLVDLDFAEKISSSGFWGILIATCIGVILHTDIISVVPVISALLTLHISFGLLFSLSASLAFFSLPMMVMVKNTIRLRYLIYTWGIVFVLVLLSGAVMMNMTI